MIYCIEITQKSIQFVYTEDAQKDIRGFLPLDLAEIKVMLGGYMASRGGSARDKLCCCIPGDIYLFYFCSVVDSIALQQKVLRAHKIGASVLNLCFRFVLERCHHLDFQSIINLLVVAPRFREMHFPRLLWRARVFDSSHGNGANQRVVRRAQRQFPERWPF